MLPPGQAERRMQLRAYNMWVGLLGQRTLPAIEDFDPEDYADLAAHGVLLDFRSGSDNPGISFLGEELARQCFGAPRHPERLSDVPRSSLLWRIADHYVQAVVGPAPIGFEAEFINKSGATILYRGILLPFTDGRRTIDYVLGVISWKMAAERDLTDELLLELDQVIEAPGLRLAVTGLRGRGAASGGAAHASADGAGQSTAPSGLAAVPGVVRSTRGVEREVGPSAPQERRPNGDARAARAASGDALPHGLRAIEPKPLSEVDPSGSEFALVMIRRTGAGPPMLLGEIPADDELLGRAARRLLPKAPDLSA